MTDDPLPVPGDTALSSREPTPRETGAETYLVELPAADYRALLNPGRVAEAAMVIRRSPGWILLQTKTHYPPGLFRLPTGTVNPTETPEQAMVRELHEEANLQAGSYRQLLRLDYSVQGGRQDFATHVYLIDGPRGELRSNDPSESIEAWREGRVQELDALADELSRLRGEWAGWGMFRAVLHRLVGQVLNKE